MCAKLSPESFAVRARSRLPVPFRILFRRERTLFEVHESRSPRCKGPQKRVVSSAFSVGSRRRTHGGSAGRGWRRCWRKLRRGAGRGFCDLALGGGPDRATGSSSSSRGARDRFPGTFRFFSRRQGHGTGQSEWTGHRQPRPGQLPDTRERQPAGPFNPVSAAGGFFYGRHSAHLRSLAVLPRPQHLCASL